MAEIKVTPDGATVTTHKARTFTFGAQGGVESVTTGDRIRQFSHEDIQRLKDVGEPGHPEGHPMFEALDIAVKNAKLHAAAQSMTDKPENASAAPKPTIKPDGWKH